MIQRGLRMLLMTKTTRFRLSSFLIYVWREFEYICFHTSCPFNLLLFSQINAHHLHGNCHYGAGSCANVGIFLHIFHNYCQNKSHAPGKSGLLNYVSFFTFFPHMSHSKLISCMFWSWMTFHISVVTGHFLQNLQLRRELHVRVSYVLSGYICLGMLSFNVFF